MTKILHYYTFFQHPTVIRRLLSKEPPRIFAQTLFF